MATVPSPIVYPPGRTALQKVIKDNRTSFEKLMSGNISESLKGAAELIDNIPELYIASGQSMSEDVVKYLKSLF